MARPVITITDVVQIHDNASFREKTVALFGCVVYRCSECYPIDKDRLVGFNTDDPIDD